MTTVAYHITVCRKRFVSADVAEDLGQPPLLRAGASALLEAHAGADVDGCLDGARIELGVSWQPECATGNSAPRHIGADGVVHETKVDCGIPQRRPTQRSAPEEAANDVAQFRFLDRLHRHQAAQRCSR